MTSSGEGLQLTAPRGGGSATHAQAAVTQL